MTQSAMELNEGRLLRLWIAFRPFDTYAGLDCLHKVARPAAVTLYTTGRRDM